MCFAGGWGPGSSGGEVFISNKNVFFYNNIIFNSGMQSAYQHIAVYTPRNNPPDTNAPNPAISDSNLQVCA